MLIIDDIFLKKNRSTFTRVAYSTLFSECVRKDFSNEHLENIYLTRQSRSNLIDEF